MGNFAGFYVQLIQSTLLYPFLCLNLPVGQIFAEVDAMNYNYEFPKLIFPSQKIQQQ